MLVMAINGSPRKKWNTATLLEKVLAGAVSQGAETELVHLYDLDFKGCISCFACKTKGSKTYGECAIEDDLTPVLKKIKDVGALVLGTPVYFGAISGEMKSFLERLMFPYRTYTDPPLTLFPQKIKTAFIYTMNVTEEDMKQLGYRHFVENNALFLDAIFGHTETLSSFDTYQFDDYSKVVADRFDAEMKAKSREKVFPTDCQKAYDMGCRLAK